MADILVVKGLPELKRTLDSLAPREARNIMRRTVTRVAAMVRDDVRAKARSVVKRRTGRLFKAIRSKRERGRPDVFEASVTVNLKKAGGVTAPHWHLIEFGTVKMVERPYIRPVVKEWDPKLPQFYREEFGKQLERELAKRAKLQ